MPTKTTPNSEPFTRRDEIVAAAVPIFLRFGYKKTSMDALAAASNLSRQAVYLHFPRKEDLFGAVVISLCQATVQTAHAALWREGLTLEQQLLAAFDETMPHESLESLSELLTTARQLTPESVADIDALIAQEVGARLGAALGRRRWPVPDVSVEQAAALLQATSYGIKEQTESRDEYLLRMRWAIKLTLAAGGLATSVRQLQKNESEIQPKGAKR